MITFKYIVGVLIICVLAYLFYDERKKRMLEKRNMSFMESIHLTGVPIVTFVNNDHIVNLILDTGSNTNLIDSGILKNLEYKTSDVKNSVIGIGGTTVESNYVLIPLEHGHKHFDVPCISTDMSETIAAIKETYGVTIHGLVGTGFFSKYKYILDFSSMTAYSKE